MFKINNDLSIYATRGDAMLFHVAAEKNGSPYTFKQGDTVRFKVFEKKDCGRVVLQKDFAVEADTEAVEILLNGEETKIGELISKPRSYWYEVELNPLTFPQTIVGYDDNGAKEFRLLPEGADLEGEV